MLENTDLTEKLAREGPTTSFERFAQNFRNMGVVTRLERGRADGHLIVYTNRRGMNVTLVEDKGHEFSLIETAIKDGDPPEIYHVLRYDG